MINHEKYTQLIQWHNAIEFFDYNLSVDWAIEFLRKGVESEYILILASFSKPVDRNEIKPYVTKAIRELNLEERYGDYSLVANVHYHLALILEDSQIRLNLRAIYQLYLD